MLGRTPMRAMRCVYVMNYIMMYVVQWRSRGAPRQPSDAADEDGSEPARGGGGRKRRSVNAVARYMTAATELIVQAACNYRLIAIELSIF